VSLPEVPRQALSRRTFLGVVGATAAGAAAASLVPSGAWALLPQEREGETRIVVRRRLDQMLVTVTFYGMTVDMRAGTITIDDDTPYRTVDGVPAGRIAVDYGPQAVLEEAHVYANVPHPQPPVRSRLAGPSRVALTVPHDLTLSLSSLLAWAEYFTATPPAALMPRGVEVPANTIAKGYAAPSPWETSIEMPWWLILSPNVLTLWSERMQPKTVSGRTEIFSSWMRTSATVRGVWIRDPGASIGLRDGMENPRFGADGYPFESIPLPADRAAFVRLTTRTGDNEPGGMADPADAQIMLTPLGGHLALDGAWESPGVSSIMSWKQRIWQGRDTYAKIVRRGFLYPWGIRAYQVDEAVRIWEGSSTVSGGVRPYWFKRTQVGVTQPILDFGDIEAATRAGERGAVFRSVTCLTSVTPFLESPQEPLNRDGWAGKSVFVPKVPIPGGSAAPFAFSFVGVDANGREVPFTMPLLFAEDDPGAGGVRANFTEEGAARLRRYYADLPNDQRAATFGGRTVGLAASANDPADTSLPMERMFFSMSEVVGAGADAIRLISSDSNLLEADGQPRNMPLLAQAHTLVEDLSRITGQRVEAVVDFPAAYLRSGMAVAGNAGLVFAKLATDEVTRIGMQAAQAGGVVVPTMDLAGFSAALGPVYGPVNALADLARTGDISPGEALRDIALLGGVSLADVLPASFPALAGTGPSAQALTTVTRVVDVGLPTERVVTTMAMNWDAGDLSGSGVAELLLGLDRASLSLTLVNEVPTGAGRSAWSVLGTFDDFTVSLVPTQGLQFVAVDVARLSFSAGSSSSSDIDVDISAVRFGGALAFVAELAEYLPFGDGLSVDVGADGIRAGLSVGVPSISLGAFTLSGIAVNTGLTLPFGSDPVRFRFGMSSTEDPFGVTVMGLGGGGWMTQDLGLDGIEYFDVAAFLQAKVALDLGVASGSVSVQIGMQFALGRAEPGEPEQCTLAAFVRIQGRVDVLGIVTVGIEVYLALGINLPLPLPADPDDLFEITMFGEATCSVRIKLAFWSKRVRFTVKRSFKGSDLPASQYIVGVLSAGDPVTPVTFADAVSRDDWATYCGAFG
jgi:hypothetical protein